MGSEAPQEGGTYALTSWCFQVLPGSLADKNLANFQTEWIRVKLAEPNIPDDVAGGGQSGAFRLAVSVLPRGTPSLRSRLKTEHVMKQLLAKLKDDERPAIDKLSPDAWVAMRGLVREWTQLGSHDQSSVPGFRGPDDWYEP